MESLSAFSSKVIAVPADVSQESDVEKLFATIDEQLGTPTALVNNAGILLPQTTIEDITAFFYITSLGPAILLAIVNGLTAGMRTMVISSLANCLGLTVLSVASILGLGLLLQTSALLFLIVKLIGVTYFLYLGVKFLFNKKTMSLDVASLNAHKQRTAFSYFSEAFLLAVTNPKPILLVSVASKNYAL